MQNLKLHKEHSYKNIIINERTHQGGYCKT